MARGSNEASIARAPAIYADRSPVEYGYDRASNRNWRRNLSDSSSRYDWLYNYDGLHRLQQDARG